MIKEGIKMSTKLAAARAALEAAQADLAKARLAEAAGFGGAGQWLRQATQQNLRAQQTLKEAILEHLGAQIDAHCLDDPGRSGW